MSAFDILLVAHFVGDFLFQTEWMAFNKQKRLFPLLVHCSLYTLIVWLCSYAFLAEPLSPSGMFLIFAGHLLLDQGSFVHFWYKRVTMCTDEKTWWLKVVHDQIFHLLILFGALYL